MYISRHRPPDNYVATLRAPVSGTVVLLGIVNLLTDVSSEAVNAVLPLYLTAVVGLGPLAYGLVDGIYQGASAGVRMLGGWLADRTGRPKWVAAGGYVLSAVSRGMLVPAHDLASVTAAVTGDRLGKGLRTAPRDAAIAASATPATQARAFGVHRALDTAGAMLGLLVAFGVLALFPFGGGYQAVFVVASAFSVVAIAVLVLLVPDVRHRVCGERARGRVTNRRMTMLAGAAGLLALVTVGDGFLFLQLAERDDVALRAFPLMLVAVSAIYLVLAAPVGRLADRIGRVRVFVGGHVALLAAYLAAAGPMGGTGATVACLVLMGAYYAATDGVLAAIAGRLVPAGRHGAGIAFAQTAVALGRFVSSLAFGLARGVQGRTTAMLGFAVLLAAVLPVAAMLLRGVEVEST